MEILQYLLSLLYSIFTNGYFYLSLLVLIIILAIATRNVLMNHWHHTFDKTKFSTQEFYQNMEAALTERKIPFLKIRRVTHSLVPIFGTSREYLRVYRHENAFEVCAAPVGTGFYVSWWFFEKATFLRRVMLRIPILRWFMTKKTYHDIDAEQVFQDLLHYCVLESIDVMTGENGATLPASERALLRLPYLLK